MGLYNKLHEVVGLLADLLSIQTLTDTTVLQLSTLGVCPFFVENVSELQLSALRLVTKVSYPSPPPVLIQEQFDFKTEVILNGSLLKL